MKNTFIIILLFNTLISFTQTEITALGHFIKVMDEGRCIYIQDPRIVSYPSFFELHSSSSRYHKRFNYGSTNIQNESQVDDLFLSIGNSNENAVCDTTIVTEIVNESESISRIENTNGIIKLNASESKYKGDVLGGSIGLHRWEFRGEKNTICENCEGESVKFIDVNSNSISNGDQSTKVITGNSWNAACYSDEVFDPNNMDFIVSWEVESTTGTIREMGGLSSNTTATTYTNLSHSMYQINNYVNRVYEGGVSKPMSTTHYLNPGDRLGIKVVDNNVSYFIDRNGSIEVIHVSDIPLIIPSRLKFSMNRGSASSGTSLIQKAQFVSKQKLTKFIKVIMGQSTQKIVDEDIQYLKTQCGMNIISGSTYGEIELTKSESIKFRDHESNKPYPVEYSHNYFGYGDQDRQSINF